MRGRQGKRGHGGALAALLALLALVGAASAIAAAPTPDPSPSGGGSAGPTPDSYSPAPQPAPAPPPAASKPSTRVTAAVVRPSIVVTPATVASPQPTHATPVRSTPAHRPLVPPRAKAVTPKPKPKAVVAVRTLRDAIGVRLPFTPSDPDDRARALLLAGLALAALATASGGFLGLYRRYRRELGV